MEEKVILEGVVYTLCCCGEKTLLRKGEEAYPLCNSCKMDFFPACTCETREETPDLNLLRSKREKSPLFAVWFYHIGNMMLSNYKLPKQEEESLRKELQEISRIYGRETIYRLLYHVGIYMQEYGCIMDAYQCFNKSFRGAWTLCKVSHRDPAEFEELMAKSAYMMAVTCGEESLCDWDYAIAFAQANLIQAEQFLKIALSNAETTRKSQRKQLLWLSEQYSEITESMSFNISLEYRTKRKAEYLKEIAEEGIREHDEDDQLGLKKGRRNSIRKSSNSKMVKEALKRIKILEEYFNLRKSVYKYFKEGKLYYSYREENIHCIDTIDYDERYVRVIEEFQDKYGYLVYHVIKREDEIILLYVTNREEEWTIERLDDPDDYLPVYVYNFENSHLSGFRNIVIYSSEGILIRRW